ncbi:BLUF domain-containing protein [Methylobacterium sp. J-076]|uniref:BLUF domain-containing protein n=1 Tax=Methylobacterium sp. J-076 TaxID=2836655 RepID=UPI001FB9D2C1|nr:BLUF domain-containing protein [Methylobacterium sp. J-076]MCJ2015093.1 BLUF domain-containing protein [Methylobacterium sp. J-076]
MSDLYRLVYASKNLLDGAGAEARAAVEKILAASRTNNARVGVTGALMFNDGAFAQVLEGPQKGVEETFERIQRDIRHGDVTVLECRPVDDRAFPGWSMAFVGRSANGRAVWDQLAAESGFDLRRLDGDAVFAMLHGLVLEEEGAAAAAPVAPAPTQPADLGAGDGLHGRALDAARVRDEIVALERSRAADPAREAEPALPRSAGDAAAIAILKAALAEERSRTTALREELDAVRILLAQAERQCAHVQQQRELWRCRARILSMALCEDPADLPTLSAPPAPRAVA